MRSLTVTLMWMFARVVAESPPAAGDMHMAAARDFVTGLDDSEIRTSRVRLEGWLRG